MFLARSVLVAASLLTCFACGLRDESAPGGKRKPVVDGVDQEKMREWSLTVDRAAFSPDGKKVLLGYRQSNVGINMSVFDVEKGERIAVLRGHEGNLVFCDFLPDGERIISASTDGAVIVHRLKGSKAEIVRRFKPHGSHMVQAGLSRNGRFLVSVGFDSEIGTEGPIGPPGTKDAARINVFDAETEVHRHFEHPVVVSGQPLLVSPSGRLALIGNVYVLHGALAGDLELLDLQRGEVVHTFACMAGWTYPVFFSADDQALVIGRRRGEVTDLWHWDLQEGKATKRIEAALVAESCDIALHSPGGPSCGVIVKDWIPWIRFWNWDGAKARADIRLDNGRLAKDGHSPSAIVISHDAKYGLVACGYSPPPDISVHIWNLADGSLRKQLVDKTKKE